MPVSCTPDIHSYDWESHSSANESSQGWLHHHPRCIAFQRYLNPPKFVLKVARIFTPTSSPLHSTVHILPPTAMPAYIETTVVGGQDLARFSDIYVRNKDGESSLLSCVHCHLQGTSQRSGNIVINNKGTFLILCFLSRIQFSIIVLQIKIFLIFQTPSRRSRCRQAPQARWYVFLNPLLVRDIR